jgi:hypothetical protein
MSKSITCGICFRAAFIADDGTMHHGSEGAIDHALDADHSAYDVDDDFRDHDGPQVMLARWQAADDAFARFDFGDMEVSAADGWEGATPSTDLYQTVHLAAKDGSSVQRVRFVVRFKDFASTEVADVFLRGMN